MVKFLSVIEAAAGSNPVVHVYLALCKIMLIKSKSNVNLINSLVKQFIEPFQYIEGIKSLKNFVTSSLKSGPLSN